MFGGEEMNGLIAVEGQLSALAQALEGEGYEVVSLDDTNLKAVDVIIVSGMDVNLMSQEEAITDVPVISASGKTVDEILEELESL